MTAVPPGPAPRPVSGWPPARSRRPGVGGVVAAGALAVLALVAVAVVGLTVGPAAVPTATVLALVPLVGVLLAIRWVDRWEPEPTLALVVAFGWGASVSVLVALVLNTGATLLLAQGGATPEESAVVGTAVVAPVVEEGVKALGVLLVFLVWRRFFDGPVDGLVYAATVAAGFAFVENILYFGTSVAASAEYGDGGQGVVTVFVLRAVASPFAHVLFTACTGLALGAASRSRSRAAWLGALPLGLLGAIGLHALWNGSAVLSSAEGFWGLYLTVQVPIFLGALGLVLWLRRREGAVVRDRLGEYAAAGWFAPQEVTMLASLAERRRARRWAASAGPTAGRAMRGFQRSATSLAYQRQRLLLGRDQRDRADEAALLGEATQARQRLVAALAGRR